MNKADYTIIDYIPEFLKYCKEEKKLSNKTLENYKRFLDKFIFWLKKNNKENIKPLEITKEDVLSYQLFLSQQQDLKTGQTLKKTTQNYYSIALRAIFDYFSIKKIPTTLSANRISLLKTDKENLKKYLKINEINNLLSLPDIKKENGLRDRVILEMLISTGIKLKQLTKFNKNILDDYKNIRLPENLIFWIKKYLEIRKDDYEPLFINYRARKNATKRLTS